MEIPRNAGTYLTHADGEVMTDRNGNPLTETNVAMIKAKRLRQEIYLQEYRRTGSKAKAAEAAQISEQAAAQWMYKDKHFAAALRIVRSQLADVLEDTSFNRALNGVSKPVYQGGQHVGDVIEHDFNREKFFLQHWKPEVYGPKIEVIIGAKSDGEIRDHVIDALARVGVEWDGEGDPPVIQTVEAESGESHPDSARDPDGPGAGAVRTPPAGTGTA